MNKKNYIIITICLLCFSQAQARTDCNINAGSVTISTDGEYKIYGNGTATADTIKVNTGVVADILLENVNIDVSSIHYRCAFDMSGATVTLHLSGVNSLHSGESRAGLYLPEGSATLTITSASGDGSTDGTLNATGGAGIGDFWNSGTIAILGGTITAIGSEWGDGIGGNGATVTISGGTITATGGRVDGSAGGDGIGGATVNISGGAINATSIGSYGVITISGGTITATGGNWGAGIGGHGCTVNISGGTITATNSEWSYGAAICGRIVTISGGTITATGSNSNAGIGSYGTITISGGLITAIGGDSYSDIYGYYHVGGAGIAGTITISGGTIIATGGEGGAGIGGIITISDGLITATGGEGGAGIGGNRGGSAGTIVITGGTGSATGGEGAVGIGAGNGGSGGNITISGSSIIAIDGAGSTTEITSLDELSPVAVSLRGETLSVNSPAAEQIEIYTLSGELLHKASKPAGKASFVINHSEGILIVRGSSGWVKKI